MAETFGGESREPLDAGLFVLQSERGYHFTEDAVILASNARVKDGDSVCDLCTGSGVVPLLLLARVKPKRVVGVEIQPQVAERAARSVRENGLESAVEIWEGRLQDAPARYGASFDVVTANPPYFKVTPTSAQRTDEIAISKIELETTLAEVFSSAASLLVEGGCFCLVLRAERVCEALLLAAENGLTPQNMVSKSRCEGASGVVYLDFVKGDANGLKVEIRQK